MVWKDRAGAVVPGDDGQDRLLQFLYGTAFGVGVVKVMIRPWVSRGAGWLMDSAVSALAVKGFVKKHGIDLADYECRKYRSFNDFFTRRVLEGRRPVAMEPEALVAPCDSKLSAYIIEPDSTFRVKHTDYTLEALLKDQELAAFYQGGTLLLFRLTVGDYHRYGFIDGGTRGAPRHIPGVFHTVNPAANDRYPIYKENTREYTLLESDHFGRVLQMEVGAAMVGRIVNPPGNPRVERGQEKGYFEFGGSTVIVLLEKGRVEIDGDILKNTSENVETVVKYGEKIGNILK